MPIGQIEQTPGETELFTHLEVSMTSRIPELISILQQAMGTFTAHHMLDYSAIANNLLDTIKWWNEHAISRAQCLCLYHIYLMFYRGQKTQQGRDFLSRITTRYQETTKLERDLSNHASV